MRLIQIRRVQLEEPVPVYDLSVLGPENFKLTNGPFVHNSKDVADSLAGVIYGLTMRREVWGMFNIPTVSIPSSIASGPDRLEDRNERLTTAQGDQRD
jgi:hypothetical protein